MRALGVRRRPDVGGLADALEWLDLPIPEPGPHEVCVRVRASSVNIDDQHTAEGTMFGGFPVGRRPTERRPSVPGTDVAGVVERVGSRVRSLAVGDRVFGIVPPGRGRGPWAELCAVEARNLARLPEGWSFEEAAGLGLAGVVACAVLAEAGDVHGRRCLVVGASGGIGSLLTAALSEAGAQVVGVCSARNSARVRKRGAVDTIDYGRGPFGAQAERLEPFDRVIDCVGGRETERQALRILKREGAFLTVVGPERYVGEERLSIWRLLCMVGYILRRVVLSRWRGPRYSMIGPLGPDWPQMERTLIGPDIRPMIDRVVPFERDAVRAAIAHVATHRARGKVMIAIGPTAEESEVSRPP